MNLRSDYANAQSTDTGSFFQSRVSPEEMAARLRVIQPMLGLVVAYYLARSFVVPNVPSQLLYGGTFVSWTITEFLRSRYRMHTLASWIVVVTMTAVILGASLLTGSSGPWAAWLLPVVPLIAGQLLSVRAMFVTGGCVSLVAILIDTLVGLPALEFGNQQASFNLVVLRSAALLMCFAASVEAKRRAERQIVSLFRQRDALEQTCAQRDQARRAASVFLSSMSAKIRTPVARLKQTAHSLDTSKHSLEEELVEVAKRTSYQVDRCITDMLDISELERGRLQLFPQELCLSKLRKDLEHWYAQQPGEGPTLRVLFPKPVPGLNLDVSRLTQICRRLLENAHRFSAANQVELSVELQNTASLEETRLTLWVRDDGVGIPAELEQQLLRGFVLHETSEASKDLGSGLSLVLVSGLAKAMGGEACFEASEDWSTVVKVQVSARCSPSCSQHTDIAA